MDLQGRDGVSPSRSKHEHYMALLRYRPHSRFLLDKAQLFELAKCRQVNNSMIRDIAKTGKFFRV
jgi:hypothetical protein